MRPLDLAHRQIDAAEQLARQGMAFDPFGQLPRRLGHHQKPQFVHHAQIGGQAQELVRRHQAATRVSPAGQGLEPRHRPGVQVHDGLEERHDLAAHEGVPQVRLQRQTAQRIAFQRPAIGGRSAATGALGRFHRQFDPPQQFGGVRRVRPALHHHRPDGDGRIDVEPGDAQRLFQGVAHPIAGVRGAARRDDGELVLADAGGRGVLGEGGGQTRPQGRQHQVRPFMAQGLVQTPQPVDVADHHLVFADLGSEPR